MMKEWLKHWVCTPYLKTTAIYVLLWAILWHPNSGFKNVVVWISASALLLSGIRRKRALHLGGLGVAIAIYLGVALLSTFLSRDVWFSLSQWMKLFELATGYFIVVNLLSSGERVEISIHRYFMAAGLFALGDLGRLLHGLHSQDPVLVHGRWFDSWLGYPTIAAGVYAATLLLGLPTLLHAQQRRQWRRVLACLLMMVGLVVLLYFLQTRSVLLGLGFGVTTIIILAPLPRRFQAGVITTVVLVLAAFVSIPGQFRERVLSPETSDRAAIWQDVDRIIDQSAEAPYRHWIGFGYGHKMFERLHATLPRAERSAQLVYNHAHNMFLETRIQTGYAGLAAWIALLALATYRLAVAFPTTAYPRRRMVAACLAGAAVAFLIYGQFSLFFAMTPALFFWTLLAACMAQARA